MKYKVKKVRINNNFKKIKINKKAVLKEIKRIEKLLKIKNGGAK